MISGANVEPCLPADGLSLDPMIPTMPLSAPARQWRVVLLCVALAWTSMGAAGRAAAQVDHGVTLVRADLLADTTAVAPGKAFTVGLRLKMAPHWHTYWQYSGDAGLPTKIDWQLPDGYKAGPILWPVPEKIVSPGDIINYGYEEEVVLLTEITPPAQLPSGGEVALQAKATWLVCADKCIPGEAQLSLKLPTGGEVQTANAETFARYRALLPIPAAPTQLIKQTEAKIQGDSLNFSFWTGGSVIAGDLDFFPLPPDSVEVDHPGKVSQVGSGDLYTALVSVRVTSGIENADQVGGVLSIKTADGKRLGILAPPIKAQVPAEPSGKPDVSAGKPDAPKLSSAAPPVPAGSLWHFLLLGFFGGLILNVMPCVLPVISLKLFSFVKQANESPARVFRLGLAYAAGVFAWFLGFAALVVAVKAAGGRQIGYSFQLQNPWFLLGLIVVSFVFALNLLGVFEFILPGGITNAAGNVAARSEGYSGAFLQGVLATVLGSACTAPIFVDALSFAFSQSGPVILTMFAAIAAGMSAPFVVLAAFPRWLRFLPKPGVWMERVKQATGFLMLATVLWLLWTFGGNRRSTDAVVWAGALLLVLGVACWVQGAFNTLVSSNGSRWTSRAVIAALVLGGGWFCVEQIVRAEPIADVNGVSFATQLANAQKTGRLVFVDFTARWCAICQSNKKFVLDTDPVQKALQDQNAIFLQADYTSYSEDIAELLHRFNAPSVPLYVIYPAGKPDAPVVLPTLLTQQTVLDALAAATPHDGASKPLAAR